MTSEAETILIIDDDVELSSMLRDFLRGEGFDVAVEHDGEAGLRRAEQGCSAIILDVMMPGQNGIEVLRLLRQSSSVPVLMLTARGDRVDRVVGLELGADDYITKPYYAREVVARLRAVLRRQQPSPAELNKLSFGKLELDPASRRVVYADQGVDLTATEFTVLQILLQDGEKVSTKGSISLRALGRKREAYDRSVDVHVSNLRLKLLKASASAVGIETVRGVGYRLSSLTGSTE